ncbi:hypothetical protein EYF80_064785 [Liparis tanakae]|uniref:Uncharacterized protein n=1 Tax=Liparis tanakae TaxID=230148 RepID=A0A4Z2E8F5_9TELE|nr:hypothetical protein EYF80_064785 [Liparis tanakae]
MRGHDKALGHMIRAYDAHKVMSRCPPAASLGPELTAQHQPQRIQYYGMPACPPPPPLLSILHQVWGSRPSSGDIEETKDMRSGAPGRRQGRAG